MRIVSHLMVARMDDARQLIESVFRRESGQVLASLIGAIGDFELAEDALQDAIVAALEKWPGDGIPPNPAGWIMITARRKAIDRIRRAMSLAHKQEALRHLVLLDQADPTTAASDDIADERLKLLFTCCHPALTVEARVALTLRTLGGLSTAEIAHAFFAPIPTMAQRLTRAKNKIRDAGIPYRVPPLTLLPERVPSLLVVLYLIFNAGYASLEGESLIRRELCAEAIHLGRVLTALLARELCDDPEALGLLALMLLQDSRREARVGPHGELVLLDEQDRSRWDRAAIVEGVALVERALSMGRPGPYQIQAAIAAVHAQAERPEDTDWREIVALYGVLATMTPSPVVDLNRAVAVAMAHGPQAGLDALDGESLATALRDYHLYHATRADLLRRLDRRSEAARAYLRALHLCQNAVERAFLTRRLAEIGYPP